MSFGGGDLSRRAQIMLELRSEGTGEASAVRQEVSALMAQMKGLSDLRAADQIALRDYITTLKDYERQLNPLLARLKDLEAAEKAAVSSQAAAISSASAWTAVIQQATTAANARKQAEDEAAAALEREIAATIKAIAAADKHSAAVMRASQQINAALESEANEAEQTAIREAEAMARFAVQHERIMGQTAEQGKSRVNSLNFSVLAFGHAFQDLTSMSGDWERGIASTLNNIPLLVTGVAGAFGMATGPAMALAGGMTVLASAGMVVYRNWSDIEGLWKETKAPTMADLMEKLGKNTHKTADETAYYNRMKKEQNEVEEAIRARSKEEQATASAVKDVVKEAGGPDVIEGIIRAKGLGGVSQADMAKAAREGVQAATQAMAQGATTTDAEAMGRRAESQAMLRMRLEARARAEAEARDVLGGAIRGDRLGELVGLAGAMPGDFPKGFAEAIAGATPQAREAARHQQAITAFNREGAEDFAKWEKLEEQKRKKREAEAAARLREMGKAQLAEVAERDHQEALKRQQAERDAQLQAHRLQQARALAQPYSTELEKAQGPGSLMDAVLGRMKKGQDATAIRAGLAGQFTQAQLPTVPPGMFQDVVRAILDSAIEKAAAQAAAGGGAGPVLEGRIGKVNDAAERAQRGEQAGVKRQIREADKMGDVAARQQAAEMAFNFAGGALTPDAAIDLAPRIVKQAEQTGNLQQAVMGQVLGMLRQLEMQQQRQQMMWMGFGGQLQGFGGQMGAMRAQRPPVMPTLR